MDRDELDALRRRVVWSAAQLLNVTEERDRLRKRVAALEKAGDALIATRSKHPDEWHVAAANWQVVRGDR